MPTSPIEDRVAALESLLTEKGIIDPSTLDDIVAYYENELGPMNGAKVVARAWVDPDYRDATARERHGRDPRSSGFGGPEGDNIVVVANTPSVHNVDRVHAVLVLPVAGARSAATLVQVAALPRSHGARAACAAARDGLLDRTTTSRSACGTRPPRCGTSCCRCDPTAPRRLGEDELAGIVTRDSMIGVAVL